MRNDIIAEIKTARAEAQTKAHPYMSLTAKRYGYWWAVAAIAAYETALAMLEQGTEQQIPDMASEAVADFERLRVRNGGTPVPEINLAVAQGRRDALNTVVDLMDGRADL